VRIKMKEKTVDWLLKAGIVVTTILMVVFVLYICLGG
jgi:hypothetical protein